MSTVRIATSDGRTSYRPGDAIEGVASWSGLPAGARLQIRLFWRTAGKGTVDMETVEQVDLPDPGESGEGDFQLQLPQGPYSFSGRLVSLVWGIELVEQDGEAHDRVDLVVSPTGEEIRIDQDG